MRASILAITAATLLAAVPGSSVSAQGVSVDVPGAGVRIGDPDRRDRDRRSHRDRDGDRVTVGGGSEGCRTVTTKKRMPDGSVVIRRKSSC
jgi:hypothetical protein